MVKWLQGKKTYLAAGAMAALLVIFFFAGALDAPSLVVGLLAAAGMAGLRSGVKNEIASAVAVLSDVKAKNYKGAEAEFATDVVAAATSSTPGVLQGNSGPTPE